MLTIGSLFSGIGGLELGLERAGLGPVKWQVEIDDYAIKVLKKHWPDVKRYRDVKEVGKHNLEPVDLICGGFPCQDVSVAGKRAGIKEGTRSGLWFEMHRIIGELRPRYALIENVPGLVSTGGLESVLCDLAEIGYDAEWMYLSATEVGAPHLRKRIFILAKNAVGDPGKLGLSGEHGGWSGEELKNRCKKMANTIKPRLQGRELLPERSGKQPVREGGLADTPEQS